jgi:predicted NBD/HSP70 family sugar kinase
MNGMNYIGLDIHKKSISCCVRQADGTIIQESTITATRHALDEWMRQLQTHGSPGWRPRYLPGGFMTICYRAAPW